MSDDELKEMMFEANKTDRDGVVSHHDFMSILTHQETTDHNWLLIVLQGALYSLYIIEL